MNTLQLHLSAALAAALSLFSLYSHAGMVVGGTRFVFSADEHGKSIPVKNTGKEGFLVKSQIVADNGNELSGMVNERPGNNAREDNPFVITPPLFLLGAGKSNQLRLECLSCQSLPADRESLFRLGISAIPGGKPAVNSVQLAVRSTFKLFYRPKGLPGEPGRAYQQLQWKREGKSVVVRNPTPYYVTFFELTVNNKEVHHSGMVAPYSSRTQDWCPATGSCEIQWKSINDFGGITPAWSITPDKVNKSGTAIAK